MESKQKLIDLIESVLDDTGRCVRFVVVILSLAVAAGLGLHIGL